MAFRLIPREERFFEDLIALAEQIRVGAGMLEVTVWDEAKPLFTRTLTAKAGEFRCTDGVLFVRSKRWVAADVVAGREDVTLEFQLADSRLVVHVSEKTYGALFAVVPIAGTATHWYRFARLGP